MSHDLSDLTAKLEQRIHLAAPEMESAAAALSDAAVLAAHKESFLLALADKGESIEEVAALAKAFQARAIDPGLGEWSPQAIDVVGTGGDHAGGFNISTLVVLTLASAGVPVMKHGNRGVTSKCGSADLLAALGADLEAPPEKLRAAMRELGFAFLFAPSFHPAFKHIVPVRKALAKKGRRTVFNILGPLINPGRPAHLLLGVFAESWVPLLAGVLDGLGTGAGLAVYGRIDGNRGIDELTTATQNRICGSGRLRGVEAVWEASDWGLPRAPFSDLLGGDLETNLALVDAILGGRGPQGLVDTIVVNTAVGLWLVGRIGHVQEGLAQARELLLGGAVRRKIADTRDFYRS